VTAARVPGLDVLRVVLVGGVVVFHATRPFDPFDYYVKAGGEVEALAPVLLFVSLWGMPLFFVLAGLAAWHSLARRGAGRFVRERAARLLVPFLAGLVLLVPPQLHVQSLANGEHVSYLDTLREFFDVHWRWELPVPVDGGLFEPAHLWFLAYLLVFTLLLLPLLRLLQRPAGARALSAVERRPLLWAAGLGLVAVAAEALLGSEEAGGWNRWAYPCFLLVGAMLAARPDLARRLGSRRRLLAVAGLLGFVVLAAGGAVLYDRLGDALQTGHDPAAVAWRAGKAAAGWLLVLAIAGMILGRTTSRQPARRAAPRWIAQAGEAVLPIYLLHQTVAVVLAWRILAWPVPAPVQWLSLTLLTVACSLALYELLRRPALGRRLLGLRPRQAPPAAPPAPRGTPAPALR
jgi:peptidoglycan/LPS O-acetylase OafA/YrhL